MNIFRDFAFLVIAFILLIVWMVSLLAFHIAGGFIHLLLIIAVIALVFHFVRRARSSV